MAVQRIRQLGDPLLREVSSAVQPAHASFHDLCDTLHQFQREHGFGRGISAVQIGRAERLIYIEIAGRTYSLINPEFVSLSADKFELWDDCFSFPNLLVRLLRSRSCRLRYQQPDGQWLELAAEGAFSELIQHEMDHLDGILAVDRAIDRHSLITRAEWLRQRKPGN